VSYSVIRQRRSLCADPAGGFLRAIPPPLITLPTRLGNMYSADPSTGTNVRRRPHEGVIYASDASSAV